MKQIFIFLKITLAYTTAVHSQSLRVELAIKWEADTMHLNTKLFKGHDTLRNLPYLLISYINPSNKSIYFRSLTNNGYQYPPLPAGFSHFSKDISETLLINEQDHSKQNFEVNVSVPKWFLCMWKIVSRNNTNGIEFVNYDIARINLILEMQETLDKQKSGKKLACFNECRKETISFKNAMETYPRMPLKSEFQWDDFRNGIIDSTAVLEFIFLKPQEVFVQKLCLLGFLIVKGGYNFKIDDNFR
jgi:hypothetical protein